jgi:hypothetical protein
MNKFLSKVSTRRVLEILGLAAFMALVATPAFAATVAGNLGITNAGLPNTDITQVQGIVQTVVASLFSVAVLVAVVNIVWQGFKLIGGNPSAAQGAKDAIIKTLIGLAVILFSWAIVGLVTNLLLKV